MALSNELISQFAKIVNSDRKRDKESTVYGTVVEDENGNKYVKLDGSDQLTPLTDDERPSVESTTTTANTGDRVSVLIKNHTATVTGNISSPSVRSDDFNDQITEIKNFDTVLAEKVQANEGYIKNLQTDKANVGDLTAATAKITELEASKASVDQLNAAKAEITDLVATKIDVEVADAKYATIENLDATNANVSNLTATHAAFETTTTNKFTAVDADITNLEVNKLDAETADLKYANIDFSNITKATMQWFYANSGLIENVVIGEGTITGELVGVTIKGSLIEGGTVVADKLVIKGEDGLYYKLNTDGVTTEAEQTDYNSLNGNIITANSITASKINVDDLVAFDATIGGFNISNSAIYSGVKSSIDNTTNGVYLDSEGQLYLGDSNNYLKYYKDENGNYILDISSSSITNAIDEKASEITNIINEQNTSVTETCESIILEALKSYTETNNFESFKETVEAQLELLSNELTVKFNQTTEELVNLNDDLNSKFNTITKYFTFDINGLTIGQVDNPYKVVINNDRYSMTVNDEEVLWLSNGQVHTPEISITKKINMFGYEINQDSAGNVNCGYVGGE